MEDWKKFFNHRAIRYINHSNPSYLSTAMASFAIDDAIAISVGNEASPPAVRLWVHEQTVVLGIPDVRLPYFESGVRFLHNKGYDTVVRNSGGLAVALDAGILNMSFILPDVKRVSIHDGYQAMVHFIQYLFRDVTNDIQAFEIKGSYCPGEYDLSIRGKKFAGISQRRVKNGTAVQIYLCVEGDGSVRAKLIQSFYEYGLQGEKGNFDYPLIEPGTMKSLSQLIDQEITVDSVVRRIEQCFKEFADELVTTDINDEELVDFEKRMAQVIDRNNKALRF
ncbi:lipoate--protein ligase family protein [Aquibacillus albus]|uniref:Octanoyl-[GcvH]:protein N-octanoyltransferase n=1 Tax=Aquibacillus albus TaxID=1168171 RepID=A0ABS2MX87_9BACI|nr:biotin/lipoate A/B protein ligase family protein [Aquibacillus albus]MBM7570506.1 octanoyl-[GcvH]:protein N-octanoyltransferase/lipoyl amidotransferase [Aquibacillus albus]